MTAPLRRPSLSGVITIAQRVARAQVSVGEEVVGRIGHGVLLLVGVERGDQAADAMATADKILGLRFFPGRTPMDLNLAQVGGSCLVVSQFTLTACLRKGNRPSFVAAAEPAEAEMLYQQLAQRLAAAGLTVATGRFAANMQVELVNDGPVTFVVRTQNGRVT